MEGKVTPGRVTSRRRAGPEPRRGALELPTALAVGKRASKVRVAERRAFTTFLCSLAFALGIFLIGGCAAPKTPAHTGDEIVVCGQFFHTGAPVVLWTDPDGYNAYSTQKRFARPGDPEVSGPRYGARDAILSKAEAEAVKQQGWTLDLLREKVDQFVIHYDACGTSRTCFHVLHDVRGLSVHFMIDLDGTIYQTLDAKERAWHATTSNDRSVGVEIANIGSFPVAGPAAGKDLLGRWYARDAGGWRVTIPPELGDGGLHTRGFVARPARDGPIIGEVQGQVQRMHDLTPQQYDSLAKLTAALCTALPKIACDYPRDAGGALETRKLSDERLKAYRGLIGHYHIQENKADPGPAFQWQRVIDEVRLGTGSR